MRVTESEGDRVRNEKCCWKMFVLFAVFVQIGSVVSIQSIYCDGNVFIIY